MGSSYNPKIGSAGPTEDSQNTMIELAEKFNYSVPSLGFAWQIFRSYKVFVVGCSLYKKLKLFEFVVRDIGKKEHVRLNWKDIGKVGGNKITKDTHMVTAVIDGQS